jgi:tetrahydromethanopterin S-methyltransferase subunit F
MPGGKLAENGQLRTISIPVEDIRFTACFVTRYR